MPPFAHTLLIILFFLQDLEFLSWEVFNLAIYNRLICHHDKWRTRKVKGFLLQCVFFAASFATLYPLIHKNELKWE